MVHEDGEDVVRRLDPHGVGVGARILQRVAVPSPEVEGWVLVGGFQAWDRGDGGVQVTLGCEVCEDGKGEGVFA